MSRLVKAAVAAGLTAALVGCSTTTDHTVKVQKFYDFLSNPGSESHAQAFMSVASESWESIGDFSGKNKSREAFVGQLNGFAKLIPDLEWSVQSMYQDGDKVIVRSRATGTPKGPFLGVDGQGRQFDIMTIDIHEIENGAIARSYHVEDWVGGLRQLAYPAAAKAPKDASQASLETVMAFMKAMGSGDMKTVSALMADDMVWLNEGDKAMPWIGPWKGKKEIMSFLGVFSSNVKTTKWENTDAFASGDTVAVFGKMSLTTTKSGQDTGEFHFALRAKVRDGQVVLWNWFEDSYAVSRAFHGR